MVLKQRKCACKRQNCFSGCCNHVRETFKAPRLLPLETHSAEEHLWFKSNNQFLWLLGQGKQKAKKPFAAREAALLVNDSHNACAGNAFPFMFLPPHISFYFPICLHVIIHNRWQQLHYTWHRAAHSVWRALEHTWVCQTCAVPC